MFVNHRHRPVIPRPSRVVRYPFVPSSLSSICRGANAMIGVPTWFSPSPAPVGLLSTEPTGTNPPAGRVPENPGFSGYLCHGASRWADWHSVASPVRASRQRVRGAGRGAQRPAPCVHGATRYSCVLGPRETDTAASSWAATSFCEETPPRSAGAFVMNLHEHRRAVLQGSAAPHQRRGHVLGARRSGHCGERRRRGALAGRPVRPSSAHIVGRTQLKADL